MNQYSRLTAAWSCCHHDIFRLFIINNLTLAIWELTKKFVVFSWSDVLVNLCTSFFLEVLINELTEVECEVVVHKTKCSIIVANHQVGIFTHYMNLAYALLVEFIQQTILFLTISCTTVGNSTYLHGVIDDDESTFNLHQFCLSEIKQCFLNVCNSRFLLIGKHCFLKTGNELLEYFDNWKVHKRHVFTWISTNIECIHNKAADVHTPFKSSLRNFMRSLQTDTHAIAETMFLFVNIAFQRKEMK